MDTNRSAHFSMSLCAPVTNKLLAYTRHDSCEHDPSVVQSGCMYMYVCMYIHVHGPRPHGICNNIPQVCNIVRHTVT